MSFGKGIVILCALIFEISCIEGYQHGDHDGVSFQETYHPDRMNPLGDGINRNKSYQRQRRDIIGAVIHQEGIVFEGRKLDKNFHKAVVSQKDNSYVSGPGGGNIYGSVISQTNEDSNENKIKTDSMKLPTPLVSSQTANGKSAAHPAKESTVQHKPKKQLHRYNTEPRSTSNYRTTGYATDQAQQLPADGKSAADFAKESTVQHKPEKQLYQYNPGPSSAFNYRATGYATDQAQKLPPSSFQIQKLPSTPIQAQTFAFHAPPQIYAAAQQNGFSGSALGNLVQASSYSKLKERVDRLTAKM